MHASDLHARLCRRPSRANGVCYEIHGDIGALLLSRSPLTRVDGAWISGPPVLLEIQPSVLFRWLRETEELRLPIRHRPTTSGVLDGEWVEVSLSSAGQAMAIFSWESQSVPEGWEPLAKLAERAFEEFDKLVPAPPMTVLR